VRFADFFCGLGGFHVAAKAVGGRCVFACEIDDRLRALYEHNFDIRPAGDIRKIDPKSIPQHDLLCAGSPCQPFSKAGEQDGFRDRARGKVLLNVLEVLRICRPEYLILENVPHFVRHRGGKTYARLAGALTALGYSIDARELSPHQFGVPQIRARMFLVGRLGSLGGFTWPEPITEGHDLDIRQILEVRPPDAACLSQQALDCIGVWGEFLRGFPRRAKLPSFPIWSMEFGATYPTEHESLRKVPLHVLRRARGVYGKALADLDRTGILALVPSHARGDDAVFPLWKRTFIEQNRELYREHRTWLRPWLPKIRRFPPSLQKLEWNCQGEERDIWRYILQFRASGLRVKRATTAPSLVAMTTTQIPIVAWERRYMCIRECARLQSLESLRALPTGGAAFKAMGNAVSAEVVKRILVMLLRGVATSKSRGATPDVRRADLSQPRSERPAVGSQGRS
jgi:DNA (cytosine-5)-methyltransferase 1